MGARWSVPRPRRLGAARHARPQRPDPAPAAAPAVVPASADDPGPEGLVAQNSYFDRRPYVEVDEDGAVIYVEHHRTLGDRVRELVAAGFRLEDIVEPEWPEGHERVWGQWSPLRGQLFPGTAIYVATKP